MASASDLKQSEVKYSLASLKISGRHNIIMIIVEIEAE